MTSLSIEHPSDELPRRLSVEARVSIIALVVSLLGVGAGQLVSGVRLEGRVNTHDSQIADIRTERDRAEARHQKTDELILEELRYLRARVDEIAARRR